MTKKVLLFPRHATSLYQMAAQAAVLRKRTRIEPIIVVADERLRNLALTQWIERGIGILDLADQVPKDPFAQTEMRVRGHASAPDGAAEASRKPRVLSELIVDARRVLTLRGALPQSLDFWRDILSRERPHAIMVPGDRELGFLPFVLSTARELKIPSVISTPSKMNATSLAALRSTDRRFSVVLKDRPPIMNMIAAWLYPKQRIRTDRGGTLFSPGWLTLTLMPRGLLSGNPWSQGGGNSTYMLVEGATTKHKFVVAGVSPEKVIVIGDLAYDELHANLIRRDELRKELRQDLGLDPLKKLLVLAVPIYAEHGLMSWPEHRRKLDEFCEVIPKERFEVLMSFHPKSDPGAYEALERKFGFTKVNGPLSAILPAGDIFLCGNSTTIDWAVKCGIPSVNLDYVKMNDRLYFDAGSAFYAQEPAHLSALFSSGQLENVGCEMDEYFDGRAAERFAGFVNGVRTAPHAP